MKNIVSAIIVAGSASFIASPVIAQDSGAFTGPRIEAVIGYDNSRPGSSSIENADDLKQSVDGLSYGVGAGFDVALGGIVLGVEGEWLRSEASSDFDTLGFQNFGVANIEADRDLYVGIRAGFLVTPSTLVYAKGGYTNARYQLVSTNNLVNASSSANLDGWRVGGGIEQSLGGHFFTKVEYRYSNYERGEFEAPSGLTSDRFDVDVDRHQVMLGLGYRF